MFFLLSFLHFSSLSLSNSLFLKCSFIVFLFPFSFFSLSNPLPPSGIIFSLPDECSFVLSLHLSSLNNPFWPLLSSFIFFFVSFPLLNVLFPLVLFLHLFSLPDECSFLLSLLPDQCFPFSGIIFSLLFYCPFSSSLSSLNGILPLTKMFFYCPFSSPLSLKFLLFPSHNPLPPSGIIFSLPDECSFCPFFLSHFSLSVTPFLGIIFSLPDECSFIVFLFLLLTKWHYLLSSFSFMSFSSFKVFSFSFLSVTPPSGIIFSLLMNFFYSLSSFSLFLFSLPSGIFFF
ncbi:unnamed protein product [Acanthosepion pharaonis]|uniref:Uncharacterized protein n=1 Tax=Acanthosepion pharaonis TaxID=158019 RepID=A0A812BTZ2_ACAPH|nr:unnamed protein product [Sepia pharaonis]